MKDVGKNIRAIRASKGMTQDALAEALFVTRQTVSNYENGRSRPDIPMVIKIAEVLGTDANAVIYGPPVPESKSSAIKWLLIAASALGICGLADLLLLFGLSNDTLRRYPAINLLRELLLQPASLVLLGWTACHILDMLSIMKPLKADWLHTARVALLILLAVFLVVPAPYVIWLGIGLIGQLTQGNVAMTFPHIPVYSQVSAGIMRITTGFPFVFFLLGFLTRICGLPGLRRKKWC